MKRSILLLHSGDSQRRQVVDLAAAIVELGSTVIMEDLDAGDYQRILDAVAQTDMVVHWPAPSKL